MKVSSVVSRISLAAIIFAAGQSSAFAQSNTVCPRFPVGSIVTEAPSLFSHDGELRVALSYRTEMDDAGRALYCFVTPDGKQSPTLHVRPGDHLFVKVTNELPASSPMLGMAGLPGNVCGAPVMTASSVNIHYHGTNVSPTCHSDEVINTLINSGETFQYDLHFPADEPAGLYWYHPHVHGIAEAAVLGGASGAIVVEGLENVQPAVAGLPQRVLIVRDNTVAGSPAPGGVNNVPTWDVSLNYIPVPYPAYTPAVIQMRPNQKQLWRVVNASADTILDLEVQYDGKPQTLSVVGLDGVPTGSQDGTRLGKIVKRTHVLLAPAARAEFIVIGPAAGQRARFLTRSIDTGPGGDNDPERTLAMIDTSVNASVTAPRATVSSLGDATTVPAVSEAPGRQRFEGLENEGPTAKRKLYFSEVLSDPTNPASPTNFYITVDGATPALFTATNPPAIVTTQGAVEDWTIENRTGEVHEFHFHQIHFLLEKKNGVPVPASDRQFLDMIHVPYWSGTGPYPSVTVRMDFRGPDIGEFVYHCHILGHEDNGMMAMIRVLPSGQAANVTTAPASTTTTTVDDASADAKSHVEHHSGTPRR